MLSVRSTRTRTLSLSVTKMLPDESPCTAVGLDSFIEVAGPDSELNPATPVPATQETMPEATILASCPDCSTM